MTPARRAEYLARTSSPKAGEVTLALANLRDWARRNTDDDAVIDILGAFDRCARDPRSTVLASGSVVVQLDVTVHEGESPASSVPVAWFDPPASAGSLAAGREVVVVGRVVRRFFRTPGGTGSRTEVVADRVVPATARARVRAAVVAAAARLGAEVP